MSNGHDLLAALEAIDPAPLDHDEWLRVGQALKQEGFRAADWDAWSQRDPARYTGDCFRRWDSFRGSDNPVTGGTIIKIARDQGWTSSAGDGHSLDWSDVIGAQDRQAPPAPQPANTPTLRQNEQTAEYIAALFDPDETVCLSASVASKGQQYRAGTLIDTLRGGTEAADIIDGYKPADGAWCVVNPTNGQGRKRDDLAAWRYVLVESDDLPEARQLELVKLMELPCAAVVSSAGKSIHAVVRVDAANAEEHAARVRDLFAWCSAHGLSPDEATKNPTRFTRLPGVARGDRMQELIAINMGCVSYAAWLARRPRIESKMRAGALPTLTTFSEVMDNLPPLAPVLIDGVLRQGHKLTLAGPSKSGKSFALISLMIAIAEGQHWLGWPCKRGPVVYVNLEVDGRSFWKRVADSYSALGYPRSHASDIHVWNLRGHSRDIAELTDDLIAIVDAVRPLAIIIDPAYKVNAGDENSAQDMARFTRFLDQIATRSGAAIVICHHHSKGAQGGKASRDRASGSGVIARDADALIDMVELDHSTNARQGLFDRLSIERMTAVLDDQGPANWREDVCEDVRDVESDLRSACREILPNDVMNRLIAELGRLEQSVAWAQPLEIATTLREFPDRGVKQVWYMCPTHVPAGDELKSARPEGMAKPKKDKDDYDDETLRAFDNCALDAGETTVTAIAECMGVKERQARNRIDAAGLKRDHGKVTR